MSYLILVRHGESRWNLSNKFTGWVDVPLSQRGVQEAVNTAKRLKDIKLDQAFVSKLERAHETLTIILSQQEMTGIFLHPDEKKESWYSCESHSEKTEILAHSTRLLNERYYGALQGLNKNEVRKKYGEEKVLQWRRGYAIRPPGGESIEDVYKRTIPFFTKRVMPLLAKGKNVIIVSHGNVMRTILKHIENIPAEFLPQVDLPSGEPLIYRYSKRDFSRRDGLFGFNRPLLWDHEKQAKKKTKI